MVSHAARFQRSGHHHRVHAHARQRAAIDVDGVHVPAGHHFIHLFEHAIERDALGRIDLDGNHKFARLHLAPEAAFRFALRGGRRCAALCAVARGRELAACACARFAGRVTASASARMCSGEVPQQPPMMRAPMAAASRANSAKYSGEDRG